MYTYLTVMHAGRFEYQRGVFHVWHSAGIRSTCIHIMLIFASNTDFLIEKSRVQESLQYYKQRAHNALFIHR